MCVSISSYIFLNVLWLYMYRFSDREENELFKHKPLFLCINQSRSVKLLLSQKPHLSSIRSVCVYSDVQFTVLQSRSQVLQCQGGWKVSFTFYTEPFSCITEPRGSGVYSFFQSHSQLLQAKMGFTVLVGFTESFSVFAEPKG